MVTASSTYGHSLHHLWSQVDSDDVIEVPPTMGGEDFSYFLEHVPGAMLFLGIGNASQRTDVNLRTRTLDTAHIYLCVCGFSLYRARLPSYIGK